MVAELSETAQVSAAKRGLSGLQVFGIAFLAMLVALVLAFFVVKYYFFPSDFNPVALNAKEQQVLSSKLQALGLVDLSVGQSELKNGAKTDKKEALTPEAYSESGLDREIAFSEREINALVANNTDMAERLAIDLSDDLVSAKLLMPMNEDFPVIGGKTLKVKAGIGLSYEGGRAKVILRGISIMGVPIPNAWMGGLKNIDLVQEFGGQPGFWQAFADGIEHLSVAEGNLSVKLKE